MRVSGQILAVIATFSILATGCATVGQRGGTAGPTPIAVEVSPNGDGATVGVDVLAGPGGIWGWVKAHPWATLSIVAVAAGEAYVYDQRLYWHERGGSDDQPAGSTDASRGDVDFGEGGGGVTAVLDLDVAGDGNTITINYNPPDAE